MRLPFSLPSPAAFRRRPSTTDSPKATITDPPNGTGSHATIWRPVRDGPTSTNLRSDGRCDKISADGVRKPATPVLTTIECLPSTFDVIVPSQTTPIGRNVPIGIGKYSIESVVTYLHYSFGAKCNWLTNCLFPHLHETG